VPVATSTADPIRRGLSAGFKSSPVMPSAVRATFLFGDTHTSLTTHRAHVHPHDPTMRSPTAQTCGCLSQIWRRHHVNHESKGQTHPPSLFKRKSPRTVLPRGTRCVAARRSAVKDAPALSSVAGRRCSAHWGSATRHAATQSTHVHRPRPTVAPCKRRLHGARQAYRRHFGSGGASVYQGEANSLCLSMRRR
jgi:hypothetical protein